MSSRWLHEPASPPAADLIDHIPCAVFPSCRQFSQMEPTAAADDHVALAPVSPYPSMSSPILSIIDDGNTTTQLLALPGFD